MLLCMKRTTLDLEEDIFRRLRQEAADTGVTLKEIVNSLLRRALGGRPRGKKRFRLNWKICRGRLQPGVRLDDRDSLYDLMEGR